MKADSERFPAGYLRFDGQLLAFIRSPARPGQKNAHRVKTPNVP